MEPGSETGDRASAPTTTAATPGRSFLSLTVYEVDPEGKIVSYTVDGQAMEPPSRPLWSYMTPSVHPFYTALHQNICDGAAQRPVSFRWFCDTPTARREMVMVVERIPTGAKYYSYMMDATPHDASFMGKMQVTADDSLASWTQCHQCLCLKDGDTWLPPEEFYHAHLEELQGTSCQVAHIMCDKCITEFAIHSEQMRAILRQANVKFAQTKAAYNALIIEDDVVSAWVTAALLSTLHCSVEVESSAAEALRILTSTAGTAYDLLVIDNVMSGADGTELIRSLRSMEHPAVIIGTADSTMAKSKMKSAGADHFLWKPIRIKSLFKALKTGRSSSVRQQVCA